MKHGHAQAGFFHPRIFAAFILSLAGVSLAMFSFAANPSGGTLDPTTKATLTWVGTATGNPPALGGVSDCAAGEGTSCDTYTLTLSGTPADWTGKQVHVQIVWGTPTTDYDLYVFKDGAEITSSGAAGTTMEQVDLNPASPSVGTGVFSVKVVYFAPNSADQYHGAASVKVNGVPPVPAPTPVAAVY